MRKIALSIVLAAVVLGVWLGTRWQAGRLRDSRAAAAERKVSDD